MTSGPPLPPPPVPWLRDPPAAWRRGTLDRDGLHGAAAALGQRPDFVAGVRRFADEWLSAYDSSAPLRAVMRNAPRYLMLIACLRLHHLRDPADPGSGITPGRLLALYGLSGRELVSAGASRVKAMLGHARAAGLLYSLPGAADGRVTALAPTPRLNEAMAHWVAGFLRGVNALLPLPAPAEQMVAHPRFVGELFTYRLSGFIEDRFGLNERVPALRTLMDRTGGYYLFLELMRSLDPRPDGSARSAAPKSGLATRAGIARASVHNLLADGEQAGWWRAEPGGHDVRLEAGFVEQARLWMGLEFVWMHGLALAAWLRLRAQ